MYIDMTDYYGKDIGPLLEKKLFLFDMDGTIYQEDTIFDGTLQMLKYIRDIGGKYVFITNNSSKSVLDYVEKVHRMGIPADEENFFTSVQATTLYLKKHYPNAFIYCQGTKSMVEEVRRSGFQVTEDVHEKVDVLLVGFDMELTMQKLRNTCEILTCQDPVYIATNSDICCPVSFEGKPGFVPDCGSMCYAIEKATGKKPTYIGKPQPTMINIVRERYRYSREETLVIGDRLYTDIASGCNAGVDTVCVLSGEATTKDIDESDVKPTYTLQDIKKMWFLLHAVGDTSPYA